MEGRRLSKIFSRERSLIYFNMWNDSNRKGYLKWLGYRQKNNLFLCPKNSKKISVWIDKKEYQTIYSLEIKKSNTKYFVEKLGKFVEKQLLYLKPFLLGKQELESSEEIKKYYDTVVEYWSAMTIIFDIPNLKGVSNSIKEDALRLRKNVEKYSDRIDDTFLKFWIKKFPENKSIAHNVSISEIIKAADSSLSKKEISEIKKRREGFGLLNGKLYVNKNLVRELERKKIFLEKENINSKVNFIYGTPVCRGRTRGNVRLVLLKEQIVNFRKDEIMVATMTSPEFISGIKKSKALITDEGGVTCHAAIVSREFKIPCIVGTKIATRILHDGDLVEVDANRGVVKIIKKA